MNREGKYHNLEHISVPRASGDEPEEAVAYRDNFGCSPRQRG